MAAYPDLLLGSTAAFLSFLCFLLIRLISRMLNPMRLVVRSASVHNGSPLCITDKTSLLNIQLNVMIALAVVLAFIVGLSLRLMNKKSLFSWAWTGPIVPAFVLFSEFVMPYQGGGASMWPIALITGGVAGMVAGGVGVAIAALIMRKSNDPI
jgi:uncharacterized membrane protein YjjP (DUF1212 family)